MSLPGWMRDGLKLATLALAVWCTTQYVQYGAHLASVDKTLTAQLRVYHDLGPRAYEASVLREIRRLGMTVDDGALAIVEDREDDEMRAELSYEWPLRVACFTLPRAHVSRTRTTILN